MRLRRFCCRYGTLVQNHLVGGRKPRKALAISDFRELAILPSLDCFRTIGIHAWARCDIARWHPGPGLWFRAKQNRGKQSREVLSFNRVRIDEDALESPRVHTRIRHDAVTAWFAFCRIDKDNCPLGSFNQVLQAISAQVGQFPRFYRPYHRCFESSKLGNCCLDIPSRCCRDTDLDTAIS